MCFNPDWECDGFPDCMDVSDESNCGLCQEYEFECANGRCIHEDWKCNGADDCGDNSDETSCP